MVMLPQERTKLLPQELLVLFDNNVSEMVTGFSDGIDTKYPESSYS